ncbi:hypothetical protein C7459_10393 [Tumebacillus permanentifrigoris]|uniref:Uncharacterized protein n=1 Tax=Tumebacillus permanentifrigoris TaxID=378543 RepID=A0A316DD02_9BACL|nr:hypothetical protein C7459_10393 [Tumebacillus permanentifrigoris]
MWGALATQIDRRLRELEDQVRAQIGRFTRRASLEQDEKERIIKFLETFLAADSGSVRDQAIRQYVLYRLGFTYSYQ